MAFPWLGTEWVLGGRWGHKGTVPGSSKATNCARTRPHPCSSTQPARLTIAEVVKVTPHPKAGDKLRIAEVDTSFDTFTVVTNALNVKRGMKVVFAVSGVRASLVW